MKPAHLFKYLMAALSSILTNSDRHWQMRYSVYSYAKYIDQYTDANKSIEHLLINYFHIHKYENGENV